MTHFKFSLMVLLAMLAGSGQQLFAQQTHREFPIGMYWTQPKAGVDFSDLLFNQLDSVGVNVPHLIHYEDNGSNFNDVQSSLDKAELYGINAIINLRSGLFPGQRGQRTRFHTENEPIGNDAERDDKFDWHGSYEDFLEDENPDSIYRVLSAVVGVHSSGLMVKDPFPQYEQQYNGTYYLKPRLRIPAIANPGQATDDVIKIRIIKKSSHTPVDSFTINQYDFLTGGSYDGSYKEFWYPYSWTGQTPPEDDGLEGFPTGEQQAPGSVTGIQIEVYWFGNVDCWLDYVMVDDWEVHRLFANIGGRQDHIKDQAKDFVIYPSLWRYEIEDEPFRDQLYACGLIDELLKQAALEQGVTEPGKGNVFQAVSGQFADFNKSLYFQRGNFDEFSANLYPIRFGMLMTPYQPPAGERNIPAYNAATYNTQLQSRLEGYLIDTLAVLRNISNQLDKPFWFIPQLHGIINTINGNYVFRDPTKEEINAMAYLGLTYSAKGIIHFLYRTTTVSDTYTVTGIVDKNLNHNSNYDFDLIPGESVYTGYKQKWDAVRKLNRELKILGLHLLKLEDAGDPFKSGETPNGPVIASVSNSGGTGVPMQFQTFQHSETMEYYLMAINRGCRPEMDTQLVEIELKQAFFSSSPILVENIIKSHTPNHNDAFQILTGENRTLTLNMLPGEGALFKLSDGLHGPIPAETYFLSGEVYLNGDLIIPHQHSLTIEQGTQVQIAAYSDAENSGNYSGLTEIIAQNDASLRIWDNAQLTTSTAAEPNQWGGIICTFNLDPTEEILHDIHISNAVIQNAVTAIAINTNAFDTRQFLIVGNTIESCQTGIQAINFQGGSDLDIRANLIEDCTVGIDLQHTNSLIRFNAIQDCDYGIICSESSHPVIQQNTVDGVTLTTDTYALYCLNNSSPYVNNNLNDPDLHGGDNVFTNFDRGVLATDNSYPLLGQYSGDHSLDGKNHIYFNTIAVANQNDNQALPVYAIYNYWGGEPQPGDFIGNVAYRPWLETEPPGEGGELTSGGGLSPEYEAYLLACSEEEAGNLSAAYAGYQGLPGAYSNSPVTQPAISGMVRVLHKLDQAENIIPELDQIITNYPGTLAADFARHQIVPYLTSAQEYTQALDHTDILLANYSGTGFEPHILIDQAYIVESQQNTGSGFSKAAQTEISSRLEEALPGIEDPALKGYLQLKLNRNHLAHHQAIIETPVLLSNYPNPFNPATTIEYHLSNPSKIRLEVFNMLGQRIRVLVDKQQSEGIHTIQWNGKSETGQQVASGIYIYRLSAYGINQAGIQAEDFIQSRKMILLR